MTINAKIFQEFRHHDASSKNLHVHFAWHAIEFRESISRKSQRCFFVNKSILIDVAIVLNRHETNARKIEKRDCDSSNRHQILRSRDVRFFFVSIYCDSQKFNSFIVFFSKSFIIITFCWTIITKIITFVKTFIIFVNFHRFCNKIHDFLFFVAFVIVLFVVTFAFVVVVASSIFVAVVSFEFVVVVFSSIFVAVVSSTFVVIVSHAFVVIISFAFVVIVSSTFVAVVSFAFVAIVSFAFVSLVVAFVIANFVFIFFKKKKRFFMWEKKFEWKKNFEWKKSLKLKKIRRKMIFINKD